MSRGLSKRIAVGVAVLLGLALLATLGTGAALGERSQHGNLIVSLDGELSPLRLPRDRPAPVAVHLEGGLKTADGAALPRVTKIELGLPAQVVVDTRGFPSCGLRRLRDADPSRARALCGGALVGRGHLRAEVHLPNQDPFQLRASLLAFNGRDRTGHRAVILYAVAGRPPAVVALPLVFGPGDGRFGSVLKADLPPNLGLWPHVSNFELTLSRRVVSSHRRHSFLSASCPVPGNFTAGFFSFASVRFTLAGGRRVGTAIARGCRAAATG
jgi:hypothetical protein